jgi:hypothetical protein
MSINDMLFMNYNPNKHPCKDCNKRHAFCHGECKDYQEFERNRPKPPKPIYLESGKMKDPFHKKGRVITKR